jgi:hypothetical protein
MHHLPEKVSSVHLLLWVTICSRTVETPRFSYQKELGFNPDLLSVERKSYRKN